MQVDSRDLLLIVDDEAADLAVLNQILYREYRIITAKTGADALRLAEELSPGLILLDIMLPGMNGYQVLMNLKGNPDTCDIPVIFISGLAGENDEEKGFLLGAVDYFTKPFRPALVKARVYNHINIVRRIRAIEQRGLTDMLTSLPDRRSFSDRLKMEYRRTLREKAPLSILLLDIDRMKKYNDVCGYSCGDALLIAAAEIILSQVRRPADHPTRIGGGKFGVVLPNTGPEPALAIAEGIRTGIENLRLPSENGGAVCAATISIGAAFMSPADPLLLDSFITGAEENLALAKRTGRNRIIPGPGIGAVIHE
ncbi:MAG: diguanylate cyclase [Treponema sp.]|nr:diguanylate cyclase [Treponema sp.]